MIFTLFLIIQQIYMESYNQENKIEQNKIDMKNEKIYILNMSYLTQEELDELV